MKSVQGEAVIKNTAYEHQSSCPINPPLLPESYSFKPIWAYSIWLFLLRSLLPKTKGELSDYPPSGGWLSREGGIALVMLKHYLCLSVVSSFVVWVRFKTVL